MAKGLRLYMVYYKKSEIIFMKVQMTINEVVKRLNDKYKEDKYFVSARKHADSKGDNYGYRNR